MAVLGRVASRDGALRSTVLWSRREPLTAIGFGLAAGGLVGAVTGVAMPRGPVTTLQALVVILGGLALGAVVGALSTSRLAPVVALLVQIVVLEFARIGSSGPTVDAVRFDNPYGVLAFATGRGFHLLIAALGVLFGTAVGRAVAGVVTPPAHPGRGLGRLAGRAATVVLGATLAALSVGLALPASTPPVLGPDGRPVEGSIAELTTVRLGGLEQAVMIRAADPDKPVLLYLSGGPGQSDIALSRVLSEPWVHDFVFVDWDQRGNGKSYPALEPLSTMTLDQAVADTIELTDYLRQRFGEQKIYLMGESWGTILGVLAVERRPDLFHAWIGSGQMIDVAETDRRIYADLRAYAADTGNADLAATLAAFGQPPYRDLPWSNAMVWSYYDYLYRPYTPSPGYLARGQASGLDPFGMLGSEYTLVEKLNVFRGLADTFAVMFPQLYDLDLRRDVPRLQVPVYILDGAAELAGRRALALEWYADLEAPSKQLVTYEGAAHSVAFEQADEVLRLLNETIVPATYTR